MNRRSFLVTGSAALVAPRLVAAEEAKNRRVAVIGHTGRGNYGHGLDTVWQKIEGVEIVAVADPDEKGLAKALGRLKISRGFSEYRRMLDEMKPEFVSVCPRHPDQHREMALAAIEAGAKGLYVEKPFCRTPAEADELVAACEKHGAKIAVAHRNRWHPVLQIIDDLLKKREIGRLLEIRGRGKGDRRGGAEDLWVLGSHVMNLMHYFGGTPNSCSAVLLKNRQPVKGEDVVKGAEGLGPLAGHEVHARYRMANGVIATFDSIAEDQTGGAGFGLQLVGSGGIINIQCDRDPIAHLVRGNPFKPTVEARPWIPITTAGVGKPEDKPDLIEAVQNHLIPVRDLIVACDEDREPLCGVRDGALVVEMICAVFDSHRKEGREVRFPLEERGNALVQLEGAPEFEGEGPEVLGWIEAQEKGIGIPIPGKEGFAFNPWTKNPVDLRGIPPGTLVRDPQDPNPDHKFRVPRP